MKTNPHDAVFYINQATNLEELALIFERIITGYGFDLFAVQYTTPEIRKMSAEPHYLTNFPREWVEHYYKSNYYCLDPVILEGKKKKSPFIWSDLWEDIKMTKEQKNFFDEASKYGLSYGVGLPILMVNNEPGVVSFVSTVCTKLEIEKIIEEETVPLTLLATSFHHAASKLYENIPHPMAPSLTKREQECLKWAAIGKTDAEIGTILGISHRTVNMHMANSYQKLNCTSREQAVVKALLMKIISL